MEEVKAKKRVNRKTGGKMEKERTDGREKEK